MRGISYTPGDLAGLVHRDTLALVRADPSSALVRALWPLIADDAPLDLILDSLAAGGLRNLPDFGVVRRAGRTGVVLVRGDITASVTTGQGEVAVLGGAVTTWLERRFDDVERVALAVAGGAVSAEGLPIGSGVVAAAGLAGGPREPAGGGDTAHADAAVVPAEAVLATRAPAGAAAPARPLPAVVVPADEPVETYDDLFGATQARTVEDAAVRMATTLRAADQADPPPPEEAAQAPDSPPTPAPPLPAALPPGPPAARTMTAPPAPPAPPATAPRPSRPGLIEGVPRSSAAPVEYAPPDQTGGGSHDSATLSRAHLLALRDAADPPLAPSVGVQAVRCPAGHPNPPDAEACRVCRESLTGRPQVAVPHPVLGVLRVSTGVDVPLDRGVIFGRLPRAERVSDDNLPRLIQLPSPEQDISRNHVEVRPDGWIVLVTDLGSTNGTMITLPGQEPQRLRPAEAVPIEPGTVVSLADEVTFVYEVAD